MSFRCEIYMCIYCIDLWFIYFGVHVFMFYHRGHPDNERMKSQKCIRNTGILAPQARMSDGREGTEREAVLIKRHPPKEIFSPKLPDKSRR